MINIYSSARYKINKKLLKEYTQGLLDRHQPHRGAVLNMALIGKRKMKDIAKEYKNEDVALPVLSFSYMDEPIRNDNLLGEIVICYPQAVLLAAERGKRVEEMFKQLIEHAMQNIFMK